MCDVFSPHSCPFICFNLKEMSLWLQYFSAAKCVHRVLQRNSSFYSKPDNSQLNYFRKSTQELCLHNRMSVEAKKLKTDSLKIGTHNGCFHCDEVLACFMLKQLEKYRNAEIIRTRDMAILNECDIVVDVGAVYDPKIDRFDHHQKSFQETLSSIRPELGDKYKTRLSSAGLIYTHFGEEIIDAILKAQKLPSPPRKTLNVLYQKVYENFIQEIDAIDNGVPICDGKPNYRITTNLSSRVHHFNPPWNIQESVDEDKQFEKALAYAGEEFSSKIVFYMTSWLPARDIVAQAFDSAKEIHESLEIIELPQQCPWKHHLFDLEEENGVAGRTKYALFQDTTGDNWRVMCVPIEPESFVCRKFLHKEWRGLRDIEIQKMSGIQDAIFCHMTGFIGGAVTREGALQMAVMSLKGDYEN